jgi:DNA-binding CsgD family transcriptional regulator
MNTLSNQSMPDNAIRLTLRETEILQLICKGLTSYEIAYTMKLSKHTVDDYRKSLVKKTGAFSSIGLLKFALIQKLYFV